MAVLKGPSSSNMPLKAGIIIGFCIFYISLLGYFRSSCYKDPTSKFFQPERAHDAPYSAHRINQAEDFVNFASQHEWIKENRTEPPTLCVGIPSVQRNDVSYLRMTLGSLQSGLTEEERASVHFVVLLAHTDQQKHMDYGQQWLANMADQLVSYDDDGKQWLIAKHMEMGKTHGKKSKFDYSIVLDECRKSGAEYVMMLEDDVVLMDGWLHRTLEALDMASMKSRDVAHSNFLYLRLFYYEALLGWNSESWPTYLTSSLVVTVCIWAFLLGLRGVPEIRPHITRSLILLVTLLFTPLTIIAFFTAGANCVMPQPYGVHLMTKNACCSQGLVFPMATVADDLLPLFQRNLWSEKPTDSLIEEHADETGKLRWALTPVVLQHVGGQSSHRTTKGMYGDLKPSRIWNFGFERNDPGRLAREHARAVN